MTNKDNTTHFGLEPEVSNIPLPSQIPPKVDLQHLPPEILRSGAIEALSHQNEDLMARLVVSMKRAVLLENKIFELEKQNKTLEIQYQQSQDEQLVLEEKDRIWHQRVHRAEALVQKHQIQIQLLETQFSELFISSQETNQKNVDKIKSLNHQNQRLNLYRNLSSQNRKKLKTEVQYLEQKINLQFEQINKITTNLNEQTERTLNERKESRQNQSQLVDHYENELKDLNEKLQKYDIQITQYQQKMDQYQALFEKSLEIENRYIQSQRELTEKQKDLEEANQELSDLRLRNKENLLKNETLKSENNNLNEVNLKNTEKLNLHRDQIESLQLLWQDSQNQIQKLNTKNEGLQNLNEQLSAKIQELRFELNKSNLHIESLQNEMRENLKNHKHQVQFLSEKKSLNFKETTSDTEVANKKTLSSIGTLVAEIQSGFSTQKESFSAEPSSTVRRGNGETAAP